MKKTVAVISAIVCCSIIASGCSSRLLSRKDVVPEIQEQQEPEPVEVAAEPTPQYDEEEYLLECILNYHSKALDAYEDLDFGLAETNIDSAFILLRTIDIDAIEDENLVWRLKTAVFSLGKELGTILDETERIAKEDYTAWIDELDSIEDFKSGRWSNEELRKIVIRISLKSDMPIEYNEQVKKAIYFFQTNRQKEMELWLTRSGRYIPLITKILQEEDLPHDLAYLSMIESGFNPNAFSRARAVGLWQFIYSTGKLYGLKRDTWVDERRDPVKSTRAAAQHLRDLYNLYNDWNMAMAAYNCGPSRVTRQFNSTPDIDFWEMKLPRETRSYVPFFMAALVIAKEPALFGFENIVYEEPFEYDTYEVHPYTSLAKAAKCAGIDLKDMRALNAELRKNHTPVGKNKYALKLPKGTQSKFAQEYVKLEVEKYSPPRVSTYYVKRGDTLSDISRKFGVSVQNLMRANNLRNRNKLSINQRLNIPGTGRVAAASPVATPILVSKKDAIIYKVRKNDTLGIIAERYKTSVSTLQKLNDMGRRTRINVGQGLYVPGKTQAATRTKSETAAVINTTPQNITYIIQTGDSLYEIAKNYGVDYKDIKRWNKIKDHRKIKPGQKIIIKITKG
ncbi:LysM peptidoglycan-binding domain-containing protein [Candidatus Omnitrophota bacterium]